MKLELNLLNAFTLRKRVNAISQAFFNKARYTVMVGNDEDIQSTNETFIGGFDAERQLYELAHQTSLAITAMIESVNGYGKTLLADISHTNEIRNQYQCLADSINGRSLKNKVRNPVTGEWEIEELKKLTDFDFKNACRMLEKRKRTLEDELAKFNSTTKITVEIPDVIYGEIYGRLPAEEQPAQAPTAPTPAE